MEVGTKLRAAAHLFDGRLGAVRPAGREAIAERLERWHKGHWVLFGPLLSAKP